MDDFDFEGPSFSLGIDLDDDEHNNQSVLVVEDSDPEPEPAADHVFKRNVRRRRLRRASTTSSTDPFPSTDYQPSYASNCNDEEEIEDFSSQDDLAQTLGESTSAKSQAMCSTSKASLPAQGSVVVKSVRKLQSNYQNEATPYLNLPKGDAARDTSVDKIKLPKITVSPLRKFQLVDSDSDDFLDNHEVHIGSVKKDVLQKTAKTGCGQTEPSGKRSVKESSTCSYRIEDLWKDFVSPKSFKISTPVLDEVCEEYSQTLKEKNDGKCPDPEHASYISDNGKVIGNITDQFVQNHPGSHGSIPPAHRYFFHNDKRIQNLVRSRLHNFYPLEIFDNSVVDQFGEPNIDYRSQFNHGGTSTTTKQPNRKSNVAGNSTKGCRNKKSRVERVSQVSESWVNPRVSASISKDASQRRVRADGSLNGGCPNEASSSGHWRTGSDGKKVYVSANGQELTGRLAYLNYKKDTGRLKKPRRKAAAKKK
ncbi:unnamed protein product [Rhodiola kirilowii]